MEKKSNTSRRKGAEPGYSESFAEIERILARFDSEPLDVDTLAAEVRRASELIRYCRERLRKAEAEVEAALAGPDEDCDPAR